MEKVHKLTDPIFNEVLNERNLEDLFHNFYNGGYGESNIDLGEIASKEEIVTHIIYRA